MSHPHGGNFLETPLMNVEVLLREYAILLEFYSELETVSSVISEALESGYPARIIRVHLDVKMQVAEKIVRESRLIAGMKKALFEEGYRGESDRRKVRQCEERLTLAVNRIVEMENLNRDLVMRQGMKIERR